MLTPTEHMVATIGGKVSPIKGDPYSSPISYEVGTQATNGMSGWSCTTLLDFIAYFDKIPDNKWCTGAIDDGNGCRCLQGHLGTQPGKSAFVGKELQVVRGVAYSIPQRRLAVLLKSHGGIGKAVEANDNKLKGFNQETPRLRVVAYLNSVLARLV